MIKKLTPITLLFLVFLPMFICLPIHSTDSVEQIFTDIYRTNAWFSEETASGFGSELKVTAPICKEMSSLIKRYDITSIVDAPCGDFNWMKSVNLGSCDYIGIDIVKELVEKNTNLYGNEHRTFKHLNLIDDPIDKVDLILCRDLLTHLSYAQIFEVLNNFKKSGSKYLLATTNTRVNQNYDISPGDWRLLNLEKPPFNFPKPVATIEEDVPFELERGKHLVLWRLEDLEIGMAPRKPVEEKLIVVFIPSYNNLSCYKKNVDSVLMQKYKNYKVLYIDDCSSDGMSDAVSTYIAEHDTAKRWSYVRNWHNCGAMSNWYYGVHSCPDEAIIVSLDGDDWFKHENVLARINEEYADENVWMTYGQYEWLSSGDRGHACAAKPEILNDLSAVRRHTRLTSQLRTFYAWLFKKIKVSDLMVDGQFFSAAYDLAMMAPMLEMASKNHFRFIDEVLYVYNDKNPLNDFRVNIQPQHDVGYKIMCMPSYQPLD